MTLLTICQNACNYAPVTAPSSIIGNSDLTAQLVLAAAQAEGNALSRRPQGGWISMILPYEFTTQASGDYTGTASNVGGVGQIQIQTVGVDTLLANLDPTWVAQGDSLQNNALVQSVSSDGQTNPTYTVTIQSPLIVEDSPTTGTYSFGKSDYSLPTGFQRPIDNTFWDRTRYWSMRGPQSPQQWQVFKSSVIGKASIQRRFRFRQINGSLHLSIDPTPFDNGADLVFEYVSNAWCQSANGIAQTSWQADTDTGVLDEYLIELGVKWRLLRRLGLSYSDEMAEYEREVDKALAVDGGAATLDLTPSDPLFLIGPWNLPETGFGADASVGGFAVGVSQIA